mmetsp:Transcript_67128/g.147159  ORF Transcript_67128/g.147159 Transcript_67128/m.147159 type:complete len:243 (-) Transcript_67128:176-904(-)
MKSTLYGMLTVRTRYAGGCEQHRVRHSSSFCCCICSHSRVGSCEMTAEQHTMGSSSVGTAGFTPSHNQPSSKPATSMRRLLMLCTNCLISLLSCCMPICIAGGTVPISSTVCTGMSRGAANCTRGFASYAALLMRIRAAGVLLLLGSPAALLPSWRQGMNRLSGILSCGSCDITTDESGRGAAATRSGVPGRDGVEAAELGGSVTTAAVDSCCCSGCCCCFLASAATAKGLGPKLAGAATTD